MREDRLTVRVFALWSGARRLEDRAAVLDRVRAHPRQAGLAGNGMLISGGVKMFMDGSGGARTAWMYDDWNRNLTDTDKGNIGYPSTPPDAYRQIVTELHDAGVHVSTHAIGDRAIDWVVETYDRALQAKPTRGLRHGVIHANTPTDRAIETLARLQREFDAGYPESSSTFMWWIGDNYAGNLGRARNARLKPFQTYLRKGVQWSGRLRLSRHAVSRSIRPVGVNRARNAERHLRRDTVRHRRIRERESRLAVVHQVGGALDVSRRSHWLDRGGQGRGPGGVGPQSVRSAHRRAQGDAVRADDGARPRGVSKMNHSLTL